MSPVSTRADGERVVRDDALQERDVGRHADDLAAGQRLGAGARSAAARSSPWTISLAIIGS